jgi:hypothetical protein
MFGAWKKLSICCLDFRAVETQFWSAAAMHIYFTISQVPELRELPKEVRRIIICRAFRILRSRARFFYWLPNLLCLVGGFGGSFLLARLLGHSHLIPMSGNRMLDGGILEILSAIMMGWIAGSIGLQLQYWKLRPLLQIAIANYISSVLHVAKPHADPN